MITTEDEGTLILSGNLKDLNQQTKGKVKGQSDSKVLKLTHITHVPVKPALKKAKQIQTFEIEEKEYVLGSEAYLK